MSSASESHLHHEIGTTDEGTLPQGMGGPSIPVRKSTALQSDLHLLGALSMSPAKRRQSLHVALHLRFIQTGWRIPDQASTPLRIVALAYLYGM